MMLRPVTFMSAGAAWNRTAGREREGTAMGHERTFGARWPVADPGPTRRDMKRGPIAGPAGHRDMKRGPIAVPDHHRDSKEPQR